MVQGLTPDDIDVLDSLAVSRRLKARVGALLSKRVSITAALLETAEPGSEMESFLLSSELLEQAEALTKQKISEILTGFSEDIREIVDFEPEQDDYACIMLTDEKIAGDIMKRKLPSRAGQLAVTGGKDEIAFREKGTEGEQFRDDPDSLKMTILTSADTETKVEAVRRMLFSDYDTIDKGNLFFAALSDEDSTVRAEALKAMNRIGLDADLADAMLALCSAASIEIPASVKRLAGILKKVTKGESVIGAKILVSRLRDDVSAGSKTAIVQTLAGMIEKILDEKKPLLEISEQVLRVFIREPYKLGVVTQEFFKKVLPHKDPEIFEFLLNEVFRIDDIRISCVIISLLFPFEKDGEKKKEMVEHIIANFNEVSGSEEGKRMVISALAVIDSSAVYTSIASQFSQFTEDIKTSVLYYLGAALRRGKIPAKTFNKLVDILVDILRTENSKLIIVLLETGMLSCPDISRAKKKVIAEELLGLWEVFTIPYLQYALEDTLTNLGAEAVEIMFEYIQNFPETEATQKISSILGNNISKLQGKGESYQKKVFTKCVNKGIMLFGSELSCKGVLAEMLGKACMSPLMTKQKAREIYRVLMDAEDYSKHRTKILEGLGWLGASPKIDFATKADLAGRLERLLNIKLPEVKGKKYQEDDMNVFVLGPEADLYTDFLPAVINGLVRIGTSLEPGRELQDRILQAILKMWKKTSTWDVILGPASSSAIVEGMQSFGTIDGISLETKKLILTELTVWKNQLYVLEAIGKMARKGPEKYEFSNIYAEVITEILGMLKRENDVYSEKEKMVILGCYADIINSRRISPSHTKYIRFINSGLTYLVRGVKEGVNQAYGWIEDLSKNTDIPKKERKEAEEVLKSLSEKSLQIFNP